MSDDWTPRQIEILRTMWGSNSPRDIGRCLGSRRCAKDVHEKARLLGLAEYKEKDKRKRLYAANKAHKNPVELGGCMIEFAPGHICSRETYTLIERART